MDLPYNDSRLKTTLSPVAGMGLFFCFFLLMFVIVSVISGFLVVKMTSNPAGAIRIATLLQDVLVFMLPAIVTAVLMTRLPARFLWIDSAPHLWPLLLAIATLFAALPCMNKLIEWNEAFTFPEGMHDLEQALRDAENQAGEFIKQILGGASFGSMIVSLCIVGLLAGLSEELFFRGAMLRLFRQANMNPHVSIWLVAIIFSIMHFQFFGFVPRMLLGAYFGYLVWWTRCLWIPVIVHAVNNSTVVVAQWAARGDEQETIVNTVGTSGTPVWIYAVSFLLTIVGLILVYRNSRRNHAPVVD